MCRSVLAKLGIGIASQREGQLSADTWSNPWSFFNPTTLNAIYTAEHMDEAIVDHDRRHGGGATIRYYDDPRAPPSYDD